MNQYDGHSNLGYVESEISSPVLDDNRVYPAFGTFTSP